MPDPVPTPTPTPAPPPAWHAGVEPEILGHAQNKGWDLAEPGKAFSAAVKAYRAAEQHVGAPADQIYRLNRADEASVKAFWQKLGAPVDPAEYSFEGVSFGDDEPSKALTGKFSDTMRATAASLNLPKETAAAVAKSVHKFISEHGEAQAAESAAALVTAKANLDKSWGPAGSSQRAANDLVARNAALALGVKPEAISALEKVVGYDQVMEMFRSIGTKIGEDKFVKGGGPGGDSVMTREAAMAAKKEAMGDPEWSKSYLAGDAAKKRQMIAWNTLITA